MFGLSLAEPVVSSVFFGCCRLPDPMPFLLLCSGEGCECQQITVAFPKSLPTESVVMGLSTAVWGGGLRTERFRNEPTRDFAMFNLQIKTWAILLCTIKEKKKKEKRTKKRKKKEGNAFKYY